MPIIRIARAAFQMARRFPPGQGRAANAARGRKDERRGGLPSRQANADTIE
jgi:hypothetical protein